MHSPFVDKKQKKVYNDVGVRAPDYDANGMFVMSWIMDGDAAVDVWMKNEYK